MFLLKNKKNISLELWSNAIGFKGCTFPLSFEILFKYALAYVRTQRARDVEKT